MNFPLIFYLSFLLNVPRAKLKITEFRFFFVFYFWIENSINLFLAHLGITFIHYKPLFPHTHISFNRLFYVCQNNTAKTQHLLKGKLCSRKTHLIFWCVLIFHSVLIFNWKEAWISFFPLFKTPFYFFHFT